MTDALMFDAREGLEQAIKAIRGLRREVPQLADRIDAYLLHDLLMCLHQDTGYLGHNSCNLEALERDLDQIEAEDESDED